MISFMPVKKRRAQCFRRRGLGIDLARSFRHDCWYSSLQIAMQETMQSHGDDHILRLCFVVSGGTARASWSVRSPPIVSLRFRCLCVQQVEVSSHYRTPGKVDQSLSHAFLFVSCRWFATQQRFEKALLEALHPQIRQIV